MVGSRKFRRQVLINGVSHSYGTSYVKAITLCGTLYTHKETREDLGKYATRTTRDIDCMACIAARCRE
jgi:hypothetical protein